MKQNFKILFILTALIIQGCSKENLLEGTQEFIKIDNVQYKIVNFDPNLDICDQISNLENNSYFEFDAGQVKNINCDIIIENKSNIIINGNNSTLVYKDPGLIGLKIKILNSTRIKIQNLEIDNNDTKPTYTNDTTMSSGKIEVFNSDYIELISLKIGQQRIVGNINGTVHQIYFKEVTNSLIKSCKIESSDGELIMLKASRENLVKNNLLNEGWSGIATAGLVEGIQNKFGYYNRIIDNTVRNSSAAFITINDRSAIVDGNFIYNNNSAITHGPGIRFGHNAEHLYASNAICKNNIIENLNFPNGNYNPVGIKVDYTQSAESAQDFTDLIISNNIIRNCQGGIKVSNQPGQRLLIKGNEITTTFWPALEFFAGDLGNQTEPQNSLVSNNVLISERETVKIYNSSIILSENYISSKGISKHDQTIKIQNIYGSGGNHHNNINITGNIIKLNGNNGIYYSQNKLEGASIKNNMISNGNLGIYIGGKNNLIQGNLIQGCSSRSIYLTTGSLDNIISNNNIYNSFENAVYLHNTTRTSVLNNNFSFLGPSPYPYAVWKNSPTTNVDCVVENNTLRNFVNESN